MMADVIDATIAAPCNHILLFAHFSSLRVYFETAFMDIIVSSEQRFFSPTDNVDNIFANLDNLC